ncbi:hypothetical protein ACTMTJ_42700 [Phytohabitans sp. LJ34]|uniref:hypothetical protein n=1 Tax=Phytohabitans sp. LJ34 TaxID=3452217 RepID=UPI003F897A74
MTVLPDSHQDVEPIVLGAEGSGSDRAIIPVVLPGSAQSARIRLDFSWPGGAEKTQAFQEMQLDGDCDSQTTETPVTTVTGDTAVFFVLDAKARCDVRTGRYRIEWAVKNLSASTVLTLDLAGGFGVSGINTAVVTHEGQEFTRTLRLEPQSATFVHILLPANAIVAPGGVRLDAEATFGDGGRLQGSSTAEVPSEPCVAQTSEPSPTAAAPQPSSTASGGQPQPTTAAPSGAGDELPVTGFAAASVLTAAFAVVTVGTLLLLFGRRRLGD